MKISVYVEEEEEPKEQEFFLKLEKEWDGITLILVDEQGEPVTNGTLLLIGNDMSLLRFSSIDKKLGFPLNSIGQLKMKGEDD